MCRKYRWLGHTLRKPGDDIKRKAVNPQGNRTQHLEKTDYCRAKKLRKKLERMAQKETHFAQDRSTIVHLFEWTWADIAKECEDFLGPQGYAGVQISPPNEVAEIEGDPWWARYQPVSYKLFSRSGNEHDLADMIARCNAVGVRIYVDIVINHMTGYKEGETIGTAKSVANYMEREYPAIPYGPQHFHPACDIQTYQDAEQVRNCQLATLIDLNQTVPHVRQMIVNYMNYLVSLGVAGFRVDAAKHMWPEDLEAIYGQLNYLSEEFGFPAKAKPYIYQEVIDLGGEAVKKSEYNHLEFRSTVGQEPLENWWENGENQIAFSRGNLGFVAFNLESKRELRASIQTGLPAGTYCDILSGMRQDNDCTGLEIEVQATGLAAISLSEGPRALAIFINSKL